MTRLKQQGFTLIELTIFLVVAGIIGVALMSGVYTSLQQVPANANHDMALSLAQGRLTFIEAQFQYYGFASGSDPCSTTPSLAICSVPSGYTVSSSITNNYTGNSNYKLITVSVSGNGSASVSSMVTNH